MPLAALPFLLIPYESLTYILGFGADSTSQTLPATALFSLLYMLLRRGELLSCAASKLVFRHLSTAVVFIALTTLANIVFETRPFIDVDNGQRLLTALRQGVSLLLGLSSYLMYQDALLRIGWAAACRWIVFGALPTFAMCGVQLMQGQFRIQGLSSEPSLLADMLVLAFLPACVYSGYSTHRRVALMIAGSGALLLSFSGTGILKAALALFSFSAVRGKAVRGMILMCVALTLTYAILLLYPDNYIFILINLFKSFLDSGKLVGGSFIDRFFGLIGPVGMLSGPHGWLGFGLGGDTVYFDRIFDPDTADAIRHEKSSIASISSLQAKMLLYGGAIGYGYYLAAWWRAWQSAARTHPARFMIPTVFAASLFSLGPLFLPYVWLWLAVGATSLVGGTVLTAPNSEVAYRAGAEAASRSPTT